MLIGEIDPAKLAGAASMSAEEALHFGLIPRMHRGIFAMNEVPELDELVQGGLITGLPLAFRAAPPDADGYANPRTGTLCNEWALQGLNQ